MLTADELDRLLDTPSKTSAIGRRNRAVLAVMGRCGLRVSEAANLRVADLHLDATPPYIVVVGKGDKERRVYPGPGTQDTLRLWLDKRPGKGQWLFPVIQGGSRPKKLNGERWDAQGTKAKPGRAVSTRYIGDMVARTAKKAGIERHVTPHMLRHTYATLLVQSKENLRTIQEALGHASVQTTQIYTQVVGDDQAAMNARLDPGVGGAPADENTVRLLAALAELPADKKKALRDLLDKLMEPER